MHSLKELEETLLKAKVQLFNRSVFLTSVCLSLRHRFSEEIPTAATNGLEVLYNPEFFSKLSFEEQVFLVAHETWHVAYDHFTRRGSREELRWNKAGDYVINLRLTDEKYVMPTGALHNPKFKDMATEEVYLQLPEEDQDQSFFIGVDILPAPPGMTEAEHKAKVQEKIIRAKIESEKAMKDIGEIPAEIRKTIDKLLNPILPWQTLLNRFLQDFTKDDYSWSRPNKRFYPAVYLPSQYSPSIKSIVVAIDTSGSISDKEFQVMCTEIQNIKDTFNPESIKVIQCDCRIQQIVNLEEMDHVLDMELQGGGGTAIEPVLEVCDNEPPTCLIYFSDLHFHVVSDPPDYPIIWVCTSNHEPMPKGWGDTIYMHR